MHAVAIQPTLQAFESKSDDGVTGPEHFQAEVKLSSAVLQYEGWIIGRLLWIDGLS